MVIGSAAGDNKELKSDSCNLTLFSLAKIRLGVGENFLWNIAYAPVFAARENKRVIHTSGTSGLCEVYL